MVSKGCISESQKDFLVTEATSILRVTHWGGTHTRQRREPAGEQLSLLRWEKPAKRLTKLWAGVVRFKYEGTSYDNLFIKFNSL